MLGAYQHGAELSKVTAKGKKLVLNLLAKNIESCSVFQRATQVRGVPHSDCVPSADFIWVRQWTTKDALGSFTTFRAFWSKTEQLPYHTEMQLVRNLESSSETENTAGPF